MKFCFILYNLLCYCIYSKKYQKFKINTWKVKRKYLGGIIAFKTNNRHHWKLSFCGIQIYSHNNKRDKFLFFTICKHNFAKKWIKKLDKKIEDKYDDIYILRHNIGETYVELMHLKERIKVNNSKNPLVIVWDEKYLNFYKMFIPRNVDLKYIPLYQADIHDVFSETSLEYKNIVIQFNGHRYFCSTPRIAENMKKEALTKPDINFYNYINDCTNIPQKSIPTKPTIPSLTIQRVNHLIKQIGLSDKFVIFAPEANSLKPMDDVFWNILAEQFSQKGYDIYVNSYLHKTNIKNAKTSCITIDELFILAQKSKGIITLGSGLSVFLTATNVPMDLIYTDFNSKSIGYDAALAIKIYSVLHLPGNSSDLIKEHNANELSSSTLSNKILARY